MKNPEDATLVQMVEGFKMFAGESVLGRATRRTRYEQAQTESVKPFASLDARWVFFDVGASLGYWSLFAKRRLFPNGRVYAIEPSPRSFELLCASIEVNGFTGVYPFNVAISDVDGEIDFALNVAHDGDHRLANLVPATDPYDTAGWQKQRVKTRRLDTLVAEQDIRLVPGMVFLKIDVQGAEPALFDGSAKLFAEARPVVLIESSGHHLSLTGHKEGYIEEWLRAQGYTTRRVSASGKGVFSYSDILAIPLGLGAR